MFNKECSHEGISLLLREIFDLITELQILMPFNKKKCNLLPSYSLK